jgi:hypothetical protein
MEAQDNLLQAKIFQEHHANTHHGKEFVYQVNDLVMLSTFNQCHEYHDKGKKRAAKFFPHWDGPYHVSKTHPKSSSYTLNLPADRADFPTYYASELKLHIANDLIPFLPVNIPALDLSSHQMDCKNMKLTK